MRKPNGMTIKSAVLCLAALSLSSCAGGRNRRRTYRGHAALDGRGCPQMQPPRRGTPEYDAWIGRARSGCGEAED